MPDLASISAAVSSLKSATDITTTILKLSKASDIQTKVTELNAVIIAAQTSAIAANSDQFALLEKVRELEGQIAEMEAWDREKERYQLTNLGGGMFAYTLKEGMENGEPPHRICANCYQQKRKSLLQSHGYFHGREKVHCDGCNAKLMLGAR